MATVHPPSGAPRSAGRIDKRNAILTSAFTVFSRLGYASACVKEIASEAGVAKPTVYNHMNDKATLFRESVEAAAERVGAPMVSSIETRLDAAGEIESTLIGVGEDLARALRDPELWALRRLACAESVQFPDLPDVVTSTGIVRVQRALGNRFARWALGGGLRAGDPDVPAAQFVALVMGPLESESALGARIVSEARSSVVVREAVDTFLKAFGAVGAAARPVAAPG